MTLGRIIQYLSDDVRKYGIRHDDEVSVDRGLSSDKSLMGLVLGLCMLGIPIGVQADDQPQELPKPFHKIAAPPSSADWESNHPC